MPAHFSKHQPSPSRLHARALAQAATIAACVVLSVPVGALAHPAGHIGRPLRNGFGVGVTPAVAGTVEGNPSGSSFEVKTRGVEGRTYAVTVSPSTTYLERDVEKPSLANVTNGELVVVFGSVSGTSVQAAQVAIFPAAHAQHQRPAAVGVVQGEPANESFEITTPRVQSETVHVSASTVYYERAVEKPSLANVKNGEMVVVFGSASEGSVAASTVVIGPAVTHDDFAVAGTVKEAPSSHSFVIGTPQGSTYTVDVSKATLYDERGVAKPSLEDLKSGDYVVVFGTVSGSTVNAERVLLTTPPASHAPEPRFATGGTVQAAPANDSFVIETWNRVRQTVDVNASTTYSEHGVPKASLEDVKAGEYVAVFGTASAGAVEASEVAIGGNPHGAGTVGNPPHWRGVGHQAP